MQFVSLNLKVYKVLVYSGLHVPQSLFVLLLPFFDLPLPFFDLPLPLFFLSLPILQLIIPQFHLLAHLSQHDLSSFILPNQSLKSKFFSVDFNCELGIQLENDFLQVVYLPFSLLLNSLRLA
jgi:hypothetical protein